jgi:hypothetical protein
VDYIELTLETDYTDGFQVLGAHAACLNGVVADEFTVEVHLFGRQGGSKEVGARPTVPGLLCPAYCARRTEVPLQHGPQAAFCGC